MAPACRDPAQRLTLLPSLMVSSLVSITTGNPNRRLLPGSLQTCTQKTQYPQHACHGEDQSYSSLTQHHLCRLSVARLAEEAFIDLLGQMLLLLLALKPKPKLR